MRNISGTFHPVDDKWFDEQLTELGIDPRTAPPKPGELPTQSRRKQIDLRWRNYISLFDLMNLFLLLDYCREAFSNTDVRFTGLGPREASQALQDIDRFNELCSRHAFGRANSYEQNLFKFSANVYEFLSFCHYFGLFDALQASGKSPKLTFHGLSKALLSKLRSYSGTRTAESTKVLALRPVRNLGSLECFKTEETIREWTQALPDEIQEAPLFRDGEFARVLGYQLALNVLEHAGSEWRGQFGSLGTIAMRVIPTEKIDKLRSSFPPYMQSILTIAQEHRGALELCIGDRGDGIHTTLKTSLVEMRKRFGLSAEVSDRDTVGFAFDEIGSRKPHVDRGGGAHALHRVLNCVAKYHGVLRMRCGGLEYVFNASKAQLFRRGEHHLGFTPHPGDIEENHHMFGTQIQLLLPLTAPRYRRSYLLRRGDTAVSGTVSAADVKLVSPCSYFYEATNYDGAQLDNRQPIDELATLSTSLMELPAATTIAFDFGYDETNRHYTLTESQIATFLDSQKAVLHSHMCIGINIPAGLAATLRDHERLNLSEKSKRTKKATDFFEVLSSEHRLLPVMDPRGNIFWFGLGRYFLDRCLTLLSTRPTSMSEEDMLAEGGAYAVLEVALNACLSRHEDVFQRATDGWSCCASLQGRALSSEAVEELAEIDALPTKDHEGNFSWFELRPGFLERCRELLSQSEVPLSTNRLLNEIGAISLLREALHLYLTNNGHLFHPCEGDKWQCTLTEDIFNQALRVVVRRMLVPILNDWGCVNGLPLLRNDTVLDTATDITSDLFKLPSRAEFTTTFIQVTSLLQDENMCYQISEWLASPIRRLAGPRKRRLSLVTTTAPSELLARGIANVLYPDYEVSFLDVGPVSSLNEDNVSASQELKSIPAVFVADIISRGYTLDRVHRLLDKYKIPLIGAVAFLQLANDTSSEPLDRTMFWDPPSHQEDPSVRRRESVCPRFFVGRVREPRTLAMDSVFSECARNKDLESRLWLVEQYSLEQFNYQRLAGALARPRERDANYRKLELVDRIQALRYGHLVYGTHHFRVTTCIGDLISHDECGGEIVGFLLDLCRNKRIDHLLLPLHSSIGAILPRLLSGIKITQGRQLRHTFCISTKTLTDRPFYVLPRPVRDQIMNCADNIKRGDRKDGLHLLILDDAVASGRTLETLIRALLRACRDGYGVCGRSPVDYVHVHVIIDRQGRARSTTWAGFRRISLLGDREQHGGEGVEPGFDFLFTNWLDLDLPVTERDSCTLCDERSALKSIMDDAGLPEDHEVLDELKLRRHEIRLQATETSQFKEQRERRLPTPIAIGRFESAQSVELVLWEFSQLLSRGCPLSILVAIYGKIREAYADKETTVSRQLKLQPGTGEDSEYVLNREHLSNLEYVLKEMARELFRRWQRLSSQSSCGLWVAAAQRDIDVGRRISRTLLAEAGEALSRAEEKEEVTLLVSLFRSAVDAILRSEDGEIPVNTRRDNLLVGCIVFCLNFRYHTEDVTEREATGNEQLAEALRPITEDVGNPDTPSDEEREATGSEQLAEALKLISEHIENPNTPSDAAWYLQDILQTARRITAAESFLPPLLTVLDHTVRAARHSHAHLLPSGLRLLQERGSLDLSTRRLLHNSLSEFDHCLNMIVHRFPAAFDAEASASEAAFRTYLTDFLHLLDPRKVADVPLAHLRKRAALLRNIFPYWRHNSLYQSLRALNMRLADLTDFLVRECSTRASGPIPLTVIDDADLIDGVYILVPNRDEVFDIIKNISIGAVMDRDTSYCRAPMIALKVRQEKKRDGVIELDLMTNFRKPADAERYLLNGQALRELERRDFRLFEIRATVKPQAESEQFSVCVSIEFHRGYATD